MRWFVIVAAVLSLIANAQLPEGHTTPEHMASFTTREQEDIREAVFRYQFQHNSSIQGSGAAVYCLTIENNADPSDDFIKRFAGSKPPVRKASDCSADAYKGTVEKATGKRGLIFRVRNIKCISPTRAEVVGGYFEDGLSASGNTYTVTKSKGRWRVSNTSMNWLS